MYMFLHLTVSEIRYVLKMGSIFNVVVVVIFFPGEKKSLMCFIFIVSGILS